MKRRERVKELRKGVGQKTKDGELLEGRQGGERRGNPE